jgi:hypothetical protein
LAVDQDRCVQWRLFKVVECMVTLKCFHG